MVTPTTWTSALILILVSLFCLGSWPNTFKRTGRWRFELFSCDFALGALLFSVIAAYTLGTLGAALGFSDRMLVAGRTNQALAVIAGGCFGVANMLFLSSVALLGMAAAFPLTIGTAIAVAAVFVKGNNLILLAAGIGLLIAMAATETQAAQKRGAALGGSAATAPNMSAPKKTAKGNLRVSTKGLLSGVIGGVALGVCLPVVGQTMTGDLGLGPYAALLLFSLGLFGSTLVSNLFFMNIAIHGGPISFNAYFNGNARQHLLGIGGGALWAAGALALGLALAVPSPAGLTSEMRFMLPPLSALLALFWGLTVWKEYAVAPAAAKRLLYLSALFFVGEVVLLGLAVS